WAVRADDVVAEAGRLRSRGVTVGHVTPMERRRPDGQTVAWDLAIVGDHGAGAMHPFIISDRTPRALRVPPSEDLAGSELTGIVGVV
ncbi:MAG: VOC family protein, partial [Gammaproteobacteria bacterium]|nr:VOC family protein [Gammaproteobacteria bacterium]